MGLTTKMESDIKNIEELLDKLRKMFEKMREVMEEEPAKSDRDTKGLSGFLKGSYGITFLLLIIIIIFFAVGAVK